MTELCCAMRIRLQWKLLDEQAHAHNPCIFIFREQLLMIQAEARRRISSY